MAIVGVQWVAAAAVLVAFSLSDDLAVPRIRGLFVALGFILVALTAAVLTLLGGGLDASPLLGASGVLLFLLIHAVLRRVFRALTGDEPSLVVTPGAGGKVPGGFFARPGGDRPVAWHDYLYSFLLGAGMLLAVAPALGEIIGS